ncbi:esterase/lipase family protein [Aeromicrobium alkaliterrae]|uniref:Alpha/beta hydrolase n=1 Tax=Aeromicrobium alkaliterrae TaxID=302168 RepID=A0ABP4W4S4_9ACTN
MRTIGASVRLVAAAVVAGIALVAPTSAQAAPAPTSAPAAAVPDLAAAAPVTKGWNNWSCTPSAAHPRPVVLVHGLGATDVLNFAVLAPRLVSAGYCVFSQTYGTTYYPAVGGLAPMEQSAAQLGTFVDRVQAATGSTKVDIVGHSEGTTVPAYYLKFLGGAQEVGTFVGFGSNFAGTTLSGLGSLARAIGFQPILDAGGCTACSQFLPGSDFMNRLNDGGNAVAGPRYVSIMSKLDTIVTPYTSGTLTTTTGADITNVVLQDYARWDFVGHLGQAIDPNVVNLVLHHLDPQRTPLARAVPFTTFGV